MQHNWADGLHSLQCYLHKQKWNSVWGST